MSLKEAGVKLIADSAQKFIDDMGNATKAVTGFGERSSKSIKDATAKLDKMISAANSASSNIGSALSSVGRAATVGITLPIAAAASASVAAFSNLNEAINAANVTFGNASKVVLDYGKNSAEAVGLSQRAFLEASVPIGASLQNVGLSAQDAANWTINLTKRAADMASVFNVDVSQAIGAIQAGLRGEADPLERFGVGLNEAAVKSYALKTGLLQAGKEMDNQTKTMARLGLLMEQTNRVQGDFINTSDGLANSSRITKAQLEDMAAGIGQKLIPIALKATSTANDLVTAFLAMDQGSQNAAIALAGIAASAGPVLTFTGGAITAYTKLDAAMKAANITMGTMTLSAGTLVVAFTAVVAVAIAAYTAYQTYNKVADGANTANAALAGSLDDLAKSGKTQNEIVDEYIQKQKNANKVIDESGALAKVLAFATKDEIKGYKNLSESLSDAGGSYEEYRSAMVKAAVANGDLNAEFVETHDDLASGRKQIDATLKTLGSYTEEEYKAIQAEKDQQKWLDYQSASFTSYRDGVESATVATSAFGDAVQSTGSMFQYQLDSLASYRSSVSESLAPTQAYIENLERLDAVGRYLAAGIAGPIKNAYQTYSDKTTELTLKNAELQSQIDQLILMGYNPLGPKVTELTNQMAENSAEMDKSKAKIDEQVKSILYQKLAATMDADAALELARAWGLVSETDYNTQIATEALTKAFDLNRDGTISASEATDDYYKAVNSLKDGLADGKYEADELTKLLNALDGKIVTSYSYVVTGSATQTGNQNDKTGKAVYQAKGGDWIVNKPTTFVAGDDGAERAIFLPLGKKLGGHLGQLSDALQMQSVSPPASPAQISNTTNNSRTVNVNFTGNYASAPAVRDQNDLAMMLGLAAV